MFLTTAYRFLLVSFVLLIGCPLFAQPDQFISYSETHYFVKPNMSPFIPIGHNDWFDYDKYINPEYARQTFANMKYNSGENLYRVIIEGGAGFGPTSLVELKVGEFNPKFVLAMDNLVAAAEEYGIYLLVAIFPNIFQTPIVGNWHHYPYNINFDPENGMVSTTEELLTDPAARAAQKNRIKFFSKRWGGSPAIFAWELWNEFNIYGTVEQQNAWLDDVGRFVRELETELYGQHHLRTASTNNAGWGDETSGIFTSKELDFTSFHTYDSTFRLEPMFYETFPMGRVNPIKYIEFIHNSSLAAMSKTAGRPVLGTEDASIIRSNDNFFYPIDQYFKDYTAAMRDDLFLGASWASFMGGTSGPNLRWSCNPVYPDEHEEGFRALSYGMYDAQKAMSTIFSKIDWRVDRVLGMNHDRVSTDEAENVMSKALSDDNGTLTLAWLFHKDPEFQRTAKENLAVHFSGLSPGPHTINWYDVRSGEILKSEEATGSEFTLTAPPFEIFVVAVLK